MYYRNFLNKLNFQKEMKSFFLTVGAAMVALILVTVLMKVAENKGWFSKAETYDADMFDADEYDADSYELVSNSDCYSYNEELQAGNFDHYSPSQMMTPDDSSFSLKITRTGTADGAVDVALFGALELATGYTNILASTYTLFENGTLNNAIADYNKVQFTYAGGDVITIEAVDGIEYPSLLAALSNDQFKFSKMRLQISDLTNGLTQYNNPFIITKTSIFGAKTTNKIVPAKWKNPNQFQTGVIDVNEGWVCTKEKTLSTVIAAVAQEYTIDFFVESSYRLS